MDLSGSFKLTISLFTSKFQQPANIIQAYSVEEVTPENGEISFRCGCGMGTNYANIGFINTTSSEWTNLNDNIARTCTSNADCQYVVFEREARSPI
jgi:hypothetical protein